MSKLAWRILAILLAHAQTRPDLGFAYLAAWTIGERLGLGAIEFMWQYPQDEKDQAMRELIYKGLVEELPDLGQRYRLVVSHDLV
jgi:hypothetical protein